MKKTLAFLLVFVVIACNQQENEKLTMTGAYYMTTQIINDGTKDSTIDRKQLKIYTDKYMMFATPILPIHSLHMASVHLRWMATPLRKTFFIVQLPVR
jgi:hypothetical protein